MSNKPRFPSIVTERTFENRVELDFDIAAEIFWFDGHFPGYPILAGVVQLQWAVHYTNSYLQLGLEAVRNFQVKYKSPIVPGDSITLVLAHDVARGRLTVEYRRGGKICTSARLVTR